MVDKEHILEILEEIEEREKAAGHNAINTFIQEQKKDVAKVIKEESFKTLFASSIADNVHELARILLSAVILFALSHAALFIALVALILLAMLIGYKIVTIKRKK